MEGGRGRGMREGERGMKEGGEREREGRGERREGRMEGRRQGEEGEWKEGLTGRATTPCTVRCPILHNPEALSTHFRDELNNVTRPQKCLVFVGQCACVLRSRINKSSQC